MPLNKLAQSLTGTCRHVQARRLTQLDFNPGRSGPHLQRDLALRQTLGKGTSAMPVDASAKHARAIWCLSTPRRYQGLG